MCWGFGIVVVAFEGSAWLWHVGGSDVPLRMFRGVGVVRSVDVGMGVEALLLREGILNRRWTTGSSGYERDSQLCCWDSDVGK